MFSAIEEMQIETAMNFCNSTKKKNKRRKYMTTNAAEIMQKEMHALLVDMETCSACIESGDGDSMNRATL